MSPRVEPGGIGRARSPLRAVQNADIAGRARHSVRAVGGPDIVVPRANQVAEFPCHHTKFYSYALIFCLLLFVAPRLPAQTNYLTPGHPDGIALLPPPPEAGSAEEAAELAAVREVIKTRTPAEKA